MNKKRLLATNIWKVKNLKSLMNDKKNNLKEMKNLNISQENRETKHTENISNKEIR